MGKKEENVSTHNNGYIMVLETEHNERNLQRFQMSQISHFCGDGNDMNPALRDTSMKLGRYVYKHELFKNFSLANQNYSNFQDGGSKFQDGCQNKY